MHVSLGVDVEVLSDRNATVAHAEMFDACIDEPNVLGVATGASKREQGDIYDPEIGVNLAVGRALINLGHQMTKEAKRRVAVAAREREEREAAELADAIAEATASVADPFANLREYLSTWLGVPVIEVKPLF